tara:strand:- start:124651 stop:125997 length:1347 start_codon:yes stop_codon:yes gene_type:complete
MSDRHFDLIVLGTGPSGGTVATNVARAGHRVAIVESRQFGGVCALRGCNPKKVYTNAAELVDRVRRSDEQLIHDGGVSIDWARLHAFKNEFTDPVARKSEKSFQDDGITTLLSDARFTGRNQIEINGETLSADFFCIATGAKPIPLPIEGAEHVTHSDEFFDLASMPNRILFIGGGYISMEFAHVVARCGKQVAVVEKRDRVLAGFDPDLVELLVKYSRDIGIDFRLGREVTSVQKDSALTVKLDDGSTIECDLVVHGAGRVPNLDGLNLDAAGIEHGKKGIRVEQSLRSVSNDAIFATGDCADSGKPRLTPVANEQARMVAKNLFAKNPVLAPDYGVIPKVAFTTPAIASVGLSESHIENSDRTVDVRFGETSDRGSVRKTGQIVAGYKIIVDGKTDAILGAHLLGPAAEETINLFALAMKHDLTATDIKSTLFAFPTFASDIRQMV